MKLFQMMINFIRLLWLSNYMIRSMVIRDMKARYVGSLMGIFWSVVNPLVQIFIYFFVFSVILKVRLGPEYGESSFALWMIAGLLPWMLFSEMISKAPTVIVEQANLIKKTAFPSEIFPIINLSSAVLNHFIILILFVLFMLLSGHGISIKIFWIVPYLLTAGILGLGISWILSSVNVFLRDVGHLTGVFLNIWFFMTPILYPKSLIPEPLHPFFELNPVLHVVEGYRMALLGKMEMDFAGYSYLLFLSLGFIVLGAMTFRKLKPAFADVL